MNDKEKEIADSLLDKIKADTGNMLSIELYKTFMEAIDIRVRLTRTKTGN